jgi:hypothetical protein
MQLLGQRLKELVWRDGKYRRAVASPLEALSTLHRRFAICTQPMTNDIRRAAANYVRVTVADGLSVPPHWIDMRVYALGRLDAAQRGGTKRCHPALSK